MVFIDESGFMLQPIRIRTWAPKGNTPIQESCSSHDKLSVISCITVAPKINRLNLYFKIYPENIRGEQVRDFLRELLRIKNDGLILILDRWSVHKRGLRLLKEELTEEEMDKLHVEWLPAYAPELNPVEGVWSHSKCKELANCSPGDIHSLHELVEGSIEGKKRKPNLLKSFFKHAGLEL